MNLVYSTQNETRCIPPDPSPRLDGRADYARLVFGIDSMETPAKKLREEPDVSLQKENSTSH